MSKFRRPGFFFVLGIFLLGACMRTPFTSVPSIINEIASTLGVKASSLGILTTLPLICFGLFASVVPIISRKLGYEVTLAIAVALLFIGSIARIVNIPLLFLGTLLVGIAITFINVLLPAIITEKTPSKIGMMTGIYTFSLAFSSSIGAAFSSPIAKATNWQFAIILLSLLALITFILWLPNLKSNTKAQLVTSETRKVNPWTNKNAWYMLMYFGLSSVTFYTLVAWLPTIAIDHGISETTASLLAGLFQFVSIIPPFFVPSLAVKMKNRSNLIIGGALATVIGIIALIFPIASVTYFVLINIVLGIATSVTFTLIMTLFGLKTHTPTETASVSGMAQSLGFLIASVGPVLTGSFQNMTGSWQTSEYFLITITIIFAIFGVLAEKNKFIFNSK